MKNFTITFVLLLSLMSNAQTYKFYQTDNAHNQLRLNSKTGEVYQLSDDGKTFLVHEATTPLNEKTDRYILHKTENMWTYILLDKFTGKLWQCQYSTDKTENIYSVAINSDDFSNSGKSKFTIQPLTSIYQFYLTNETTGDMWRFQWNPDDQYRWILRFM